MQQQAECFYCIRVFRNPDETRIPNLWNGFFKGSNLLAISTKLKQTKIKLLVSSCFLLFHRTVKTWTDLLISVMKDVFVIFARAAFQSEAAALCIDLLSQFWKVEWSIYAGISLTSFNHQNVAKRKFLFSNFRSPKVQYKEKWAVDVFRNWQASRKKNHILYSSRGVCSNCAKCWRKAEGPA